MERILTRIIIEGIGIWPFLMAVYNAEQTERENDIQHDWYTEQDRNGYLEYKYENILAKTNKAQEIDTEIILRKAQEIKKDFTEIIEESDNLENLGYDLINNKYPNLTAEERINIGEDMIQKATEITNKLKESNDKWENLCDYLSNRSIDGGVISQYIADYWHFLETLDFNQKWAVVHISGTIFILISIFSIITTIYGDKLINYLNLEKKLPKIAKFIELRSKIKQSYIILNVLLIIMVLVITLYLNISILFF